MAEAHIKVNDLIGVSAALSVPGSGAWFVDVDMASDAALSGRVTVKIGELSLSGTIDERASGTFGRQRRVRVVAGGGAWGTALRAKAYHNDAGVTARNVAEDAARECGEILGSFTGRASKLAVDYVRQAGPAARALEAAARGAAWWVDYAGTTHVGERVEVQAPSGAYEVLTHDPRHCDIELAVNDLATIGIGSILSERLDSPQTIRAFELIADARRQRMSVWTASEGAQTQILDSMRAIVSRLGDGRLHGKWRYRVIKMNVDRVDLQAISQAPGLPDLATISMWLGLPGAHSELTEGAEVLVEFVEGDRELPIISAVVGKGGNGFTPKTITIEASQGIELGGAGGQPVARQGDAVECPLPPGIFSGTIGGAPASGVITFPVMKIIGTITGGSAAGVKSK